jgi:hypothetical protein
MQDYKKDVESYMEPEPKEKEPKPPKIAKDYGKLFTDKIKRIVLFIGYICSAVGAAAYLLVVVIMNVGFKASTEITGDVVFAAITAVVGLLISQSLKWQGIIFAKNEPDVKAVWERFYGRKTKQRKYKSLTAFWTKSIITDVLMKAISIITINLGIIYVFIAGNGDPMRILMAFANLIMFAGFGMTSLTKAYDFTKEQHVPWMEHQIEIENTDVTEQKKSIDNNK